jgi:large repetitive protein
VSLKTSLVALGIGAIAAPRAVHADPSSGVDSALFRPSYDTSGIFSLEGARLSTKRDLSWKMLLGFASSPLNVDVGDNNISSDTVLNYTLTLDMAFGFTVTKKFAVGVGTAVYRADTGPAYGTRGRFTSNEGGISTGMISLRELSNMDPSGHFQAQSLSGPLDVRVGGKYQFLDGPSLAATFVGTVVLPFGEDEMFLGDHNLVFEPKVAVDYRKDRLTATKVVANLGARIRQRTVIETFDNDTVINDMVDKSEAALAVLDVGSELVAGVGGLLEVSPSFTVGIEAVGFVPLPGSLSYGSCNLVDGRRCSQLQAADYFGDKKKEGDLAAYAAGGLVYRVSPHLTGNVGGEAGLLGARGDDFRVMFGVVWSPQPESEARVGRGDKDGDGLPDLSDGCPEDAEDKDNYQDEDGCPDLDNDGDGVIDVDDRCVDEPEDRDTYQDDDGCPERDNDGDGIQDVADRCPDDAEDVDGFEDDDGCSDEDNDGDGFADKADKCPNEPEKVNGVDDDDGCPDTRTDTGPQLTADRVDLRGNRIEFTGATTLTPASKILLNQVAAILKSKPVDEVSIRIEVHVALGTKSKAARAIADQKKKDKALSQRRADAVFQYLQSQGVTPAQMPGVVGLGSDRPLGTIAPTDAGNERVDFIRTRTGGTP